MNGHDDGGRRRHRDHSARQSKESSNDEKNVVSGGHRRCGLRQPGDGADRVQSRVIRASGHWGCGHRRRTALRQLPALDRGCAGVGRRGHEGRLVASLSRRALEQLAQCQGEPAAGQRLLRLRPVDRPRRTGQSLGGRSGGARQREDPRRRTQAGKDRSRLQPGDEGHRHSGRRRASGQLSQRHPFLARWQVWLRHR